MDEFSSEELLRDYAECLQDTIMCMTAVAAGVLEYNGNCVVCRIEKNLELAAKIREELMRREDPVGAALSKMEPKYG